MRIVFLNGEHPDVDSAAERLRVGSAPDNDLVLRAAEVAAHHLTLFQDRRGLVLAVEPGAGRVHVNARPVREKALLRFGDVLSVGSAKFLLQPDPGAEAERIPPAAPAESGDRPGRAALRAVAGPLSGHLLGIDGRLDLPLAELAPAGVAVELRDGALWLETRGTVVQINGVAARQARLAPGDQLCVGAHRYVIEAPGLQAEASLARQRAAFVPHEAVFPEDTAGPRGEVWWLIVTAALLGLGIALLLLFRP